MCQRLGWTEHEVLVFTIQLCPQDSWHRHFVVVLQNSGGDVACAWALRLQCPLTELPSAALACLQRLKAMLHVYSSTYASSV
jgi:hypothetical protein